MPEKPTIGIRFTDEELELLTAIEAHEERTRSDVVRRAVRHYAERLGVKLPTKGPRGKRSKPVRRRA